MNGTLYHRGSALSLLSGFLIALTGLPLFADLHLAVTAGPDAARHGETLDVSFTVTNDGPFDRTDVQLVFDYPTGLTTLSDGLFDGACPGIYCEPGEQATFSLDLPAGSGRSFSLPLQVASGTAEGTVIPLDVAVFDDGTEQASAGTVITVEGGRELELALANNRDPVRPGEEMTYTLAYGIRESSGGAAGTLLQFPVPSGTTFVSASGGGMVSANQVQWAPGNLNPGTGGKVTVTLRVNDDTQPGTIVTAVATLLANGSERVAYTAAARVEHTAPLELSVAINPDPARRGETLNLELTIGNTDTFDRTGVTLFFEVPDHLVSIADSLFDGGCPGSYCEAQERAWFSPGTLPAGSGRTWSIPLRVAGTVPDGVVISFEAEVYDVTGARREAGATLRVANSRKLELALTGHHDPVPADGLLNYTLTYGVLSSSTGLPDATLELTLPKQTQFVSADGGGILQGDTVVWSPGPLNPGAHGRWDVVVSVDHDTSPGTILQAFSRFEDGHGHRVDWQDDTHIEDPIPLDLALAADPDPVRLNETIDLELTVTNTGTSDRTGIYLALDYPDHLEDLADSLFAGYCPGSYCEAQEKALFSIGTLPAGTGITYSIPARVTSTEDGTVIDLQAQVYDGTGVRRESATTLRVDHGRELELALGVDRDPVAPGEELVYTLTYGLLANGSGIAGATPSFTLPQGTRLLWAGEGAILNNNTISWPAENFNPGDSGERKVRVLLDPTTGGTVLTAEAHFGSVHTVTCHSVTRIQPLAPLNIGIMAAPDPAIPGETLDVEISVTNSGTFDRTGVYLYLEIPDHLISLGDSLFDGDCPGSYCEAREKAVFNMGTIAAGKGKTVSLPIQVSSQTLDGTVIPLEVEVVDTTGHVEASTTSIVVDAQRTLDLVLEEDRDTVAPGALLNYTLYYGVYNNTSGANDAVLRFTIPPGTVFASSADCVSAWCRTVEWSLCDLPPGGGGKRSLTVEVLPDTVPGTLLVAEAVLIDDSGQRIACQETTRVENGIPLDLRLSVIPGPAQPDDTLDLELTVTNTTSFDRTGVNLALEFPDHLYSLADSSFAGSCPGSYCEAQERAWFAIGTLAAGQTLSYSLSPVVRDTTPLGTTINFDAFLYDGTGYIGSVSGGVLINNGHTSCMPDCSLDTNGDGIYSPADLYAALTFWKNADLPGADQIDLNMDGRVDIRDFIVIVDRFASSCSPSQ